MDIESSVWKDIKNHPSKSSLLRYSGWLQRTKTKVEDIDYSSLETESTAYKIKRFLLACFRNIEVST